MTLLFEQDGEHVGLLRENELNFVVHFRRIPEKDKDNKENKDKYNGEFGFDWLREEYKNSCLSYYDLKNEYDVETINEDKEYFIPWLAMFKDHKSICHADVKLQLETELLL